jgi:hypothetical protein
MSDINVRGRKRDESSSPLELAAAIATTHIPSQEEK